MTLVRSHAINDDDWATIVQSAKVNNLPREEINRAIVRYHCARTAHAQGQPKATRSVLMRLSKEAKKLSNDIATLSRNPRAAVVLTLASVSRVEFVKAMKDSLADRQLTADQAQLKALADRLARASSRIASTPPGRAKSIIQHFFIKELADIYQRCTGTAISRSIKRHNRSRDFITAVCHIADPNIGVGSIDEAMKRLIKARGEKAPTRGT